MITMVKSCPLSTANNKVNMKQMMRCEPDLSIPVEELVITEYEVDENVQTNKFKTLEMSATRNCMLLECKFQELDNSKFT